MDRCVVLNFDYSFLNTVSIRRAIRLIISGKSEVVKYTEKTIKCSNGTCFKIPAVIKLIKLVRAIYKNHVPFSKKNVLIRDNFKCLYCGSTKNLTIDHVIPVSKGGKSSFNNCVTACRPCNSIKGNRTPSEARLYLRNQPYDPTISEFFRLKMKQLGIDKFLEDLKIF